jgi:CO/xanthine dehydrogenase FAD-binding subunit
MLIPLLSVLYKGEKCMLLKLVEYHWAEDVDDVLLLLGRLDVKTVPLAGGTYLLGLQDDSIEAVIDLRDLNLAYISEDTRGIHIGAMTTLQQIVDARTLQEGSLGILSRAAQASSSSRLIRNSATVGGTLGAGIASQADLWTALVALDAEVVVRSGSQTQVNLGAGSYERPGLALSGVIFKGKQERRIACHDFLLERRASELIIEIVIPRPEVKSGAAFQRISRTATDVALLNVAALVEINDASYQRVRLVFGGVNMEPVRLYAVERRLEGQLIEEPLNLQALLTAVQTGLTDFRPPSDIRASSGYRRVSGANLAYHALEEALSAAYWREVVSSERGM